LQQKQLLALIYGWIFVFIVLISASVIIALLLKFTSLNEPLLSWITLAVGLVSLFIGGLVAGLKGQMKGWMIGLVIGIGFTCFTLMFQYVSLKELFTWNQMLYHTFYILAAMVGGIVGVNRIAA